MKTQSRITIAFSLLILLFGLMLTRPVNAAGLVAPTATTRYVSTTGTDSGDCSNSGSPCLTIAYAYTQSATGDTISVAAGTYTEASGYDITKNLTISGAGTMSTIVQAAASAGITDHRFYKVNAAGITVNIQNLTLRYGVEASGGALNVAAGTLNLTNVILSDNQVNNVLGTGLNGGALSVNGGTANITNSAIINNSVTTNDTTSTVRGSGGGIFLGSTGTITLNNTTVSGNSSIRGGGGVFTNGGTININYSTIANNTSNNADGIAYTSLDGGGINRNGGTINLKSSIVAGNKKGVSSPSDNDCSGTITSQGYNLTGSSTGCSLAGTGDVTVTPSTVFTAVLGSLSDNGGATYTHALIVSGAAVNAIPNGTNSCGTSPFDYDQRGGVRPYNSTCDMGAYELKTVHGVSTTGTDSGDCTVTDCASIAYAYGKSQAGDTISVAAGTYTETSGYDITKNLTISGAGATSTIVQAAASAGIANHRFYKVNASGITVNIQNLTLRYGVEASGGALNVAAGTLNLTNVVLSDNQVNNALGTGLNGGALSVNGGTANITNSAIINNSVTTNDTTASVRGSGGGIFLGSTGTITLNNTTVSGNSSIRGGGGLFTNGGTIHINYSTIANNTSNSTNGTAYTSLDGGGINRNGGTINLKSSIVAGNKKYTSTTDVTADCSGTITSQGYNLTGTGTGCSLSGTGDVTVSPANVFTSVLGSLANNGGSTYTHALMVASPARNVIPSGTNTCGTSPFDVDQRGMSRPLYGYCDIGAYEYQDATLPTVNNFSATSPTNSLSIPITAFTASDNTGVIGYLITETSTSPSAGSGSWIGTAPTTYIVGGDGSYTLYPWVKDAAGNVSALYGTPASVTVDTTAPTVGSFTATSPSSSLNIPITAFTASDAMGVTGYLITASATPPSAGASGWTGTAPTIYTVGSAGSYTLYPWAKDTVGNVSAVYGSPANVTVDLAPMVTSFAATSPSSSLNIPITSFTASDDLAVTGYLITESSTPPSVGASGWTGSAPTIYTVGSVGSYTLYPWAKDAAGNVSSVYGSPAVVSVCSLSVTVTSNADSGAGTLRQAITDTCVGGTIDFDSGLSGATIYLASTLSLSKNVTIDGSALAVQITISGDSDNNGTGDVRVFSVSLGATVTLDSLTIKKGSTSTGAGIFNDVGSTLTINNSTLTDNATTGGPGGGIRNDGTLTIKNSTFSNNSAVGGSGGGIRNTGALMVTNSTFSNNTTTGSGGGIYNVLGFTSVMVTNSTFSGNSAGSQGGGIYYSGGVLNYANTIIADSTSGGDCAGDGTIGTNINNLVEDGSCSAALSGDPSLDALADNGGPTQTFALLAGSSAIDAGDDTTCTAAPVNGLDQRGVTRPEGAHCDIGAYEYEYQPIVTKLADTNDGVCDNDCSLREAIATVDADDTITFASSLSGGTIHLTSTLTIAQNMTIDGSALASKITVSGDSDSNGTGDVRVFFVHSGMTVTLDSLIITKGAVSGDNGGGIYNDTGNNSGAALTVTNSIISGNAADNGGGIFNSNGSTLTIKNSTISNNAATNGGGVYSDGQLLAITGSTISGNTATGGNGGGIRNGNITTLTNSTLSGNSATGSGGGIFNDGALTMINSTLSGNSASVNNGGGVYSDNALNYTNTIIANSTSGSDCVGDGTVGTNLNNLVEDGTCPSNGVNFLTGDPNLGSLADHGGPTQTFALFPGSSAIDAGDDATCLAAPVNNLDQRGMARTVGLHCDIGAYERTDTSAPTVDSFTVPSPATSLNIPITAFTASDNILVTGYLVTESSTPPSVTAIGWTASTPTTYTVGSAGSYTLYPWAKDAAGNVSSVYGSPASVIVCLSSITITNNADSGTGTLRQAIANTCEDGTVNFHSSLSGDTIHLVSTLIISKNLTIDGSALASQITISGDSDNNGTGDVRVFYVNNLITVTLDSLIVTKGQASGSGINGEGGAILNYGWLTITNSTFSNNSSTGSGGAISVYRTVTISDSTFSGNSSADNVGGGGAILNSYILTISGSTFSGNSASATGGAGGAIFNAAPATITNSTFFNNSAAIAGAIITIQNLSIENSTLAGNTAGYLTGGLEIEAYTTNLSNTLIANNFVTASGNNEDCLNNATIGININNLIEDGTCSPSLSGDPNLGALADNGGPTQTLALLAGSPAIDAGDNSTCEPTDQRGVARPVDATCDIGSFELDTNYIPVSVGDAYTTTKDTPLTLLAPGVLANDLDGDWDTLTATLDANVSSGTLTFNSDGSFNYTPNENFCGTDSFTYHSEDDTSPSSTGADVILTITCVNAGADQTVEEGELTRLNGSYPDPGLQTFSGEQTLSSPGGFGIHWDFGDGATATGTLTPTHTYVDDGAFTVTLTITGTEGISTDTLVVTVLNVAPVLTALSNQNVEIGELINFTASFTDLGILDTHSATVDWGDSTVEAGAVDAGTVSGFHTYTNAGVYTVTITLTDDDGGMAVQTFTVTVTEPATSGFQVFLPIIVR